MFHKHVRKNNVVFKFRCCSCGNENNFCNETSYEVILVVSHRAAVNWQKDKEFTVKSSQVLVLHLPLNEVLYTAGCSMYAWSFQSHLSIKKETRDGTTQNSMFYVSHSKLYTTAVNMHEPCMININLESKTTHTTSSELSCLISIAWAPPSCKQREASKHFKMKIYVSTRNRISDP